MDDCGAAHITTAAVLFMATLVGDFLLSGYQLDLTSNFMYRVRNLLLTTFFEKVKLFKFDTSFFHRISERT